MNIGAHLKIMRGKKTLRQVAKKLDCDFTWLSKVENNKEIPSWETLVKILKLYGEKDFPLWAKEHLMRTKQKQFLLAIQALPF